MDSYYSQLLNSSQTIAKLPSHVLPHTKRKERYSFVSLHPRHDFLSYVVEALPKPQKRRHTVKGVVSLSVDTFSCTLERKRPVFISLRDLRTHDYCMRKSQSGSDIPFTLPALDDRSLSTYSDSPGSFNLSCDKGMQDPFRTSFAELLLEDLLSAQ
jgi:hypothetical protein